MINGLAATTTPVAFIIARGAALVLLIAWEAADDAVAAVERRAAKEAFIVS